MLIILRKLIKISGYITIWLIVSLLKYIFLCVDWIFRILGQKKHYKLQITNYKLHRFDKVSVVIPSWNGKKLLEKHLPSVVEAALAVTQSNRVGTSPAPTLENNEIIVVDDNSTDGSIEMLKKKFSYVRVIELKEHRGFSHTCNIGVKNAKNEIVILLNNDVAVNINFISPLVEHFKIEQSLFGVGPKAIVPMENFDSTLEPFKGFTHICGGFVACDKNKFLAVGGFDELFSPFYWEDTDISYRALKRGWKLLWEPKSIVYHTSGETIKKRFKWSRIETIANRNYFLLVWKNLNDGELIKEHWLWLRNHLFTSVCGYDIATIKAFIWALTKVPLVFIKRVGEYRDFVIPDKEIWDYRR